MLGLTVPQPWFMPPSIPASKPEQGNTHAKQHRCGWTCAGDPQQQLHNTQQSQQGLLCGHAQQLQQLLADSRHWKQIARAEQMRWCKAPG